MKKFTHLLAETDRLYDAPEEAKYWAAVEAAQQELDRLVEGIVVRVENGVLTLEYNGRQMKTRLPVGEDMVVEPSGDICFFGLFLIKGGEIVGEELTWLLGMSNGEAEIACERLTVPEALVRRVQEAVCAASAAGQA
jgi:hypothetical protein